MHWMALVALVACTDSDSDTNETPDTGMPDTGMPDTGPDPKPEDLSAALDARIVDESATPVDGALVRFCRGPECRYGSADATGAFAFELVAVGWHSLEVIPPMQGTGLATAFVPLEFETDEMRSVDLVMPPLDAPTTLPSAAAPLPVGDGLTIELAAGNLEPPLFIDEATEVAGVRLDEAQWVPVDGEDGTVVAQWFLEPFDHKPKVDIPMTFTNDYALAEGSALRVVVGDYTSSEWIEAGTLTVTGGELVGTVNLPVTSTVVLLDTTAE